MTVLVLYAGGTIGMESTASGYQLMHGFEAFLKIQISSRIGHLLPKFDVISFDKLIDSSNLMPSDWTNIGQELLISLGLPLREKVNRQQQCVHNTRAGR